MQLNWPTKKQKNNKKKNENESTILKFYSNVIGTHFRIQCIYKVTTYELNFFPYSHTTPSCVIRFHPFFGGDQYIH